MPGKTPIVDVHSHVLPRPLIEAIAALVEENPLAMLDQLTGLSNQQRDLIHGLNALALIGEAPKA